MQIILKDSEALVYSTDEPMIGFPMLHESQHLYCFQASIPRSHRDGIIPYIFRIDMFNQIPKWTVNLYIKWSSQSNPANILMSNTAVLYFYSEWLKKYPWAACGQLYQWTMLLVLDYHNLNITFVSHCTTEDKSDLQSHCVTWINTVLHKLTNACIIMGDFWWAIHVIIRFPDEWNKSHPESHRHVHSSNKTSKYETTIWM